MCFVLRTLEVKHPPPSASTVPRFRKQQRNQEGGRNCGRFVGHGNNGGRERTKRFCRLRADARGRWRGRRDKACGAQVRRYGGACSCCSASQGASPFGELTPLTRSVQSRPYILGQTSSVDRSGKKRSLFCEHQ